MNDRPRPLRVLDQVSSRLAAAPRCLSFKPGEDFETWREAFKRKVLELLGPFPEPVPLHVETIERDLKVKAGDTSEDGQFTLDTVNCLGACALAPLVVADGDYHGKMSQKNVGKLLQTLDKEEE